MKTEKISKLTLILGVVLLVVSYIIPNDILENTLDIDKLKNIRGIIIIYIVPILGIIGSVFSIYKKQWLFLGLNIILVINFFIFFFLAFTVGR